MLPFVSDLLHHTVPRGIPTPIVDEAGLNTSRMNGLENIVPPTTIIDLSQVTSMVLP